MQRIIVPDGPRWTTRIEHVKSSRHTGPRQSIDRVQFVGKPIIHSMKPGLIDTSDPRSPRAVITFLVLRSYMICEDNVRLTFPRVGYRGRAQCVCVGVFHQEK